MKYKNPNPKYNRVTFVARSPTMNTRSAKRLQDALVGGYPSLSKAVEMLRAETEVKAARQLLLEPPHEEEGSLTVNGCKPGPAILLLEDAAERKDLHTLVVQNCDVLSNATGKKVMSDYHDPLAMALSCAVVNPALRHVVMEDVWAGQYTSRGGGTREQVVMPGQWLGGVYEALARNFQLETVVFRNVRRNQRLCAIDLVELRQSERLRELVFENVNVTNLNGLVELVSGHPSLQRLRIVGGGLSSYDEAALRAVFPAIEIA